jgi:hypothetical protein
LDGLGHFRPPHERGGHDLQSKQQEVGRIEPQHAAHVEVPAVLSRVARRQRASHGETRDDEEDLDRGPARDRPDREIGNRQAESGEFAHVKEQHGQRKQEPQHPMVEV